MIYKKVVIEEVPRILGLMDRNPLSKTYGCFDRNYWHYKISDFPCARFQEGILTLALLHNMKTTRFFKNEELLSWIVAGLNFWKKIQNRNGSFNEWYPNENSFVATAFSTYAVTEALILLKNEIKKFDYLDSINRAGNWLTNKTERKVQNQEAGSIMALHNIYLITGNQKFKKLSEEKLEKLIKSQTREGWFYEYGGPDIGYLSLCIDYLAKYYKKTGDKKLLKALKKSTKFLKYFLHPDMTVGGTYGSRNTRYIIPSGFEILSAEDENAKTISEHIIRSLEKGVLLGPSSLDDRYLVFNGYNYLQAFENLSRDKIYKPMYKKNFMKDFSEAGILLHSYKGTYLIVNYKKGGSYKYFHKKKLISSDSGIEGIYKNQKILGDITEEVDKNDGKFIIKGGFRLLAEQTLSPTKNLLLRLFQLSLGKNDKISNLFKEKMRDRLITSRSKLNLEFKRTIIFKKEKVKIKDSTPKNLKIAPKGNHSYDFIPSSKYFQYSDLN